jgi:hypothetical protein
MKYLLLALACTLTLTACDRRPTAPERATVLNGHSVTDPAPVDSAVTPDSVKFITDSVIAASSAPIVRTPIPTYDGSGQSLHPSVLFFPNGWRGWRFVMAYTPYPFLDPSFENPSIAVSQDGLTWVTPTGTVNPLLAGAGRSIAMSDPDLLYLPDSDQVELCARQYNVAISGEQILCETSGDLVRWSPPTLVLRGSGGDHISPTFVLDPTVGWRAWFVRGACGDSTSTVLTATAGDTTSVATDLAQPGTVIWHIQVRRFLGAFWALYTAYRLPSPYGCTNGDLFLARSTDGIHWTTSPTALLVHHNSTLPNGLYRSSLVYDSTADALTLFVSGFEPSSLSIRDGPTIMPGQGTAHLGNFAALRMVLGL